MVDRAFKLNVGRQGFGSVNPEIPIMEGRISEVLLWYNCRPVAPYKAEQMLIGDYHC